MGGDMATPPSLLPGPGELGPGEGTEGNVGLLATRVRGGCAAGLAEPGEPGEAGEPGEPGEPGYGKGKWLKGEW